MSRQSVSSARVTEAFGLCYKSISHPSAFARSYILQTESHQIEGCRNDGRKAFDAHRECFLGLRVNSPHFIGKISVECNVGSRNASWKGYRQATSRKPDKEKLQAFLHPETKEKRKNQLLLSCKDSLLTAFMHKDHFPCTRRRIENHIFGFISLSHVEAEENAQ